MEGERHVAVGELLEQESPGHRRARVAVAAERFRDRALHETELPSALDDVVRDLRLLVGLAGRGTEDLAREARHRLADELLLLGRFEVHHVVRPPVAATPASPTPVVSHVPSCSTSVSSALRRSISTGLW